jgi:hypothetical protein
VLGSPLQNCLDDIGRQRSQPQDATDVRLPNLLRHGDLADGGGDAIIDHPLPPPRPRERLDQSAVGPVLGRRSDLAAVGGDDALAAAAALEAHGNADDERRPVEPGLNAPRHAAFLSPCCRSSATRLASPPA